MEQPMVLEKIVPEIAKLKTTKKVISYLDILEYQEYNEDGLDIVNVHANGESFLVNMTFTAFHEWMTQEGEDYKMNQL